MRVKDKFELVYSRTGELYNVFPITKNTLEAYKVDKFDSDYLEGLVITRSRIKKHSAVKLIETNMKNCVVVNFPEYPLPGFVTKEGTPVVNVASIGETLISDYKSDDIYCIYLYTIVLSLYINRKPFPDSLEIHISNYIFLVFMNLFAKKYGLVGSYRHLIPKLRFLINLYVYASFVGGKIDDKVLKKKAAELYIDYNSVNTNFDFTSSKDFLKSINKNQIIPLSENVFSNTVIKRIGMTSLPLFEDMSRFFATILATTVSGNSIFSPYWAKLEKGQMYNKLVEIAVINAERANR